MDPSAVVGADVSMHFWVELGLGKREKLGLGVRSFVKVILGLGIRVRVKLTLCDCDEVALGEWLTLGVKKCVELYSDVCVGVELI